MDTHQEDQEKVIEEEDEDGGWVDTHHFTSEGTNTLTGNSNFYTFIGSFNHTGGTNLYT